MTNEEYLEEIGHPVGSKIYNTNGKECAKVIGYEHRHCACGKIGKIKVLWPDGAKTLLCPKGLEYSKGEWKICG